jgi:hypothetical protein
VISTFSRFAGRQDTGSDDIDGSEEVEDARVCERGGRRKEDAVAVVMSSAPDACLPAAASRIFNWRLTRSKKKKWSKGKVKDKANNAVALDKQT